MARKIVQKFDHQVELRESLDKVVLVGLVLFEIRVEALYKRISISRCR